MTFNDTQFTGYPDPIWEKSMQELLAGECTPKAAFSIFTHNLTVPGTLFRISEAELKRHGSDAIPLKGGGFAAGLGISHHLHCVVRLHYNRLNPIKEDADEPAATTRKRSNNSCTASTSIPR